MRVTEKKGVRVRSHCLTHIIVFFFFGGYVIQYQRAGGKGVCAVRAQILSLFCGKKKEKKKKEGDLWVKSALPCFNLRVTRGELCGSNFSYRLKISIHPTKKCGLYEFDPVGSTRFAISNPTA